MQDLVSLVINAIDGDEAAFESLVLRFQNMAFAVAYAMLYDAHRAQDAAQDAFLEAYQNLSKLREPAAFPGWFRRIVVKHSDRQNRRIRTVDLPIEAAGTKPASGLDPALILEKGETQAEIHAAIANLPEKQRLVTTLFYVKGYSLKEIAEILEMPQNNVKKYLFTARQKLKRRMIAMIADRMQDTRPSKDDQFANNVAFFLALRAGDTQRLEALLDRSPELVKAKTEWGIASEGYYWPTGITGIHWAALTGNEALLKFLLMRGADVNHGSGSGITPLHFAVLMQQKAMVSALIDTGAWVNPVTKHGHTPLHFAAMRGHDGIAADLISRGARPDAADSRGRSPVDWACLKGYEALISVLGGDEAPQASAETGVQALRMISLPDVKGVKIIGEPSKLLPPDRESRLLGSPVLETGIKIVDLLAPIQRGGRLGVFTPLPGVGKLVILGQMISNLARQHGGCALCLGIEDGSYTAENLHLAWREWGVDEQTILVFGEKDNGESSWDRVIESGVGIAEELRDAGREVLLIVDVPPTNTEDLLAKTSSINVPDLSNAAISQIFMGDFSVGALPDAFGGLDGVITFDVERARRSLWPAVDPLRSWSAYFEGEDVDKKHVEIARKVKKAFWRAKDLRVMVENRSIEALEEQGERESWLRTERIDRFLTQRFTGAEPWTGDPGDYVSLEQTLAGCQAILEGECDELPEEALYFIGRLEEAFSRQD
jgi:F-type H+-transporting ATPase subunit beta